MSSILSDSELRRYARHLILPEFGRQAQEKLKAASVLIVGLGGLGSPAALYLAAAGVGRIGLVDADSVEESNLQRQIIHGTSTLGVLKVESAAARLRDINPDICVEPHAVRLSADNAEDIVSRYDLVLDGTDNFPARYLVNDVCVKLGKINVFAGVMRFEGQLAVFDAQTGPCYRCVFPAPPPPELAPNCAEAGVLGVLPGIMGTMQAGEAIKVLAGVGEPLRQGMLLFDGLDLRFDIAEFAKNPNCPCCSNPAKVTLVDMTAVCSAPVVRQITPVEASRRIAEAAGLLLIDVRTATEVEAGQLPGALHIERADLPAALEDAESPVNRALSDAGDVILICRSGARSLSAIQVLIGAGFSRERLYNLEGGLLAWKQTVDPDLNVV